jgi:hypothetical protein
MNWACMGIGIFINRVSQSLRRGDRVDKGEVGVGHKALRCIWVMRCIRLYYLQYERVYIAGDEGSADFDIRVEAQSMEYGVSTEQEPEIV